MRDRSCQAPDPRGGGHGPSAPAWALHAPLALTFASGFTGLVYEVLWLKELGLLFGNTSYATATTLAVFFLGLAAGSWYWGGRAAASKTPLAVYAFLELGVAGGAVLYYGILPLYRLMYSPLFSVFGSSLAAFTAVKFVLATLLLFPAAFFMGGTLPAMGQHLVRRARDLGRTGSLVYAVNTAGGALGAYAAGFHLPLMLGFRLSYVLIVAFSLAIAAAAWAASRCAGQEAWEADEDEKEPPACASADRQAGLDHGAACLSDDIQVGGQAGEALRARAAFLCGGRPALAVAFVSGFATLGVEVLWTRMFAQVLLNSVYSFAAILAIFLLALALGGLVARLLCRLGGDPWTLLGLLAAASGLALAASSILFYHVTDGLTSLMEKSWTGVASSGPWWLSASVVFVPAMIMGCVFPFLMRVVQGGGARPARAIGLLLSANTFGGIAGSLAAGFLLIGTLGMWNSIGLMAVLYAATGVAAVAVAARPWTGRAACLCRARHGRQAARAAPAFVLVAVIVIVARTDLPALRLEGGGFRLIEAWEGSQRTVAVVAARGPSDAPGGGETLIMRTNGWYWLGSTAAWPSQERQAHLPLLIGGAGESLPRSAFFLGLATGITAGAALRHPVRSVTLCEISPEVLAACRKYFGPFNNGLFEDRRARVVLEDGRNFLMGTSDKYDVIVADLFFPWEVGTGSLYSREHFQTVRSRLADCGVFAQWLPLFQLSRREFGIIVRTMLDVFPQVTLWRGSFEPDNSVVALVGQTKEAPLDPRRLVSGMLALAGDGGLGPGLADILAGREIAIDAASREEMAGRLAGFVQALPFTFYAGNLGENRALFRDFPVNTDDRPLVEYLTPTTFWKVTKGEVSWFVSLDLVDFLDDLARGCPPERDPYLARLSARQVGYVRAGLSYQKALAYRRAGRAAEGMQMLQDFQAGIGMAFTGGPPAGGEE